MRKTLLTGFLCLAASLTTSCATTSTTEKINIPNAQDSSEEHKTDREKPLPTCAQKIQSFVLKTDKSLEVLSEDGLLYTTGESKTDRETNQLLGKAEEYLLLPAKGLILHFLNDKIMLEKTDNARELFKLDADPQNKTAYFSHRKDLMALKDVNGRYNVWNIQTQFENISATETIETFMSRQRPDHRFGFPKEVRALALGHKSSAAVAIDDLETQRLGLIYYTNEEKAPGKLKVLARSNTEISKIALSSNEKYVAAIDKEGQFYFALTDEKEFRLFARDYKAVKDIGFIENDPYVVQSHSVERISAQSGSSLWKTKAAYHECQSAHSKLYCRSDHEIIVLSGENGKILKRQHFCP